MAKRGSGLGPLLMLGIGAGLMYLLDPEKGEGRRAQLRDKVATLQHDAERLWAERGPEVVERAQGLVSEATRRLSEATGQGAAGPSSTAGSPETKGPAV